MSENECPICAGERDGRLPLTFDRRALCARHAGPLADVEQSPPAPPSLKIRAPARERKKLEQKALDLEGGEAV